MRSLKRLSKGEGRVVAARRNMSYPPAQIWRPPMEDFLATVLSKLCVQVELEKQWNEKVKK